MGYSYTEYILSHFMRLVNRCESLFLDKFVKLLFLRHILGKLRGRCGKKEVKIHSFEYSFRLCENYL